MVQVVKIVVNMVNVVERGVNGENVVNCGVSGVDIGSLDMYGSMKTVAVQEIIESGTPLEIL